MLFEQSYADMGNGRDTLTNVGMIRCGEAGAFALNAALADENAAVAITGTVPSTRTDDVSAGTKVAIDVSGRFTCSDGASVTYAASEPTDMGGATVECGMVTFNARPPREW